MANLLNFNSSRDLGFDHVRDLQFDLNRKLDFDLNRVLIFDPNRDLGFGKRGVLFRGYVCENCGAIVSPDATSCGECGAEFREPKIIGVMKAPPSMTAQFQRESTATPAPVARGAPAPVSASTYPPAPAPRTIAPPKPIPPPAPMAAPAPAGAASRFCPTCGARSWSGDAFCWNCGARFTGSTKAVTTSPTGSGVPVPPTVDKIQLPPKKVKKVVKDWQETDKSFEGYVEEK